MKIIIDSKPQISPHRNKFVISIDCFYGDGDGDTTHNLIVDNKDLGRILLEIEVAKRQFKDGRGGCRKMYHQCCYFLPHWKLTTTDKEFWSWFDDFPYDSDTETNYTITSHEVIWYNVQGIAHSVSIKFDEIFEQQFSKEIKTLNKNHKIGDYKVWDTPGDDDHLYQAYREDAVMLVKKFIPLVDLTFE